jgi:hypothetical protein
MQIASDNFQRANENPLSDGGNWSIAPGANAEKIVSNAVEPTIANAYCISYWNALSWPNNQYSEITIGSFTGAGYMGPAVRIETGGTQVNQYWGQLEYESNSTLLPRLVLDNNGSAINLIVGNIIPFSTGDVWRLSVMGTTLTLYQNAIQILTAMDSTFSSGAAGLGHYSESAITSNTISAWDAGNLLTPEDDSWIAPPPTPYDPTILVF